MKTEFIFSKFTKVNSNTIHFTDAYLEKYNGKKVYVRVELIKEEE